MGKKWMVAAVVAMCLSLSAGAVAKDHGKGNGGSKGNKHEIRRDVRWSHDHDRDHKGRPPGWSKGKKTGWGNCDVPPGQAKKQGCNDWDRHRRRVYRSGDTRRTTSGGWSIATQTAGGTRTTTTRSSGGAWGAAKEAAKDKQTR